MMHKYPAESKPYKTQSLPNPSSVQFYFKLQQGLRSKRTKEEKNTGLQELNKTPSGVFFYEPNGLIIFVTHGFLPSIRF